MTGKLTTTGEKDAIDVREHIFIVIIALVNENRHNPCATTFHEFHVTCCYVTRFVAIVLEAAEVGLSK